MRVDGESGCTPSAEIGGAKTKGDAPKVKVDLSRELNQLTVQRQRLLERNRQMQTESAKLGAEIEKQKAEARSPELPHAPTKKMSMPRPPYGRLHGPSPLPGDSRRASPAEACA